MGHGKLLDFGANLDRVTLGQGPGRVRLESEDTRRRGYVSAPTRRSFSGNNFSASAALAQVCALLNAS